MKNLLLLFFLFLFNLNLKATTYTVVNVDALHIAVDMALPGDEIVMADTGEWHNPIIYFFGNGTATAPITLRAETPGMVVLSGNCEFRIGGTYLVVSGLRFQNCVPTQNNLISFRRSSSVLSSHCRLTETAIIDCNHNDATMNSKWVNIFGDNNEVDHCYFEGKTNIGATLAVNYDSIPMGGEHHIHHNLFGPQAEGLGNSWEAMRIGDSETATYFGTNLIEHNYFYQVDGEIETISGKSSNCTYRYNILKECSGGLTLRHGTDCLVEGNIFLGEGKSGSYGIRVIDNGHSIINNYFADLDGVDNPILYPIVLTNGDSIETDIGYQHVFDILVAHNTIVDCTRGIMVGGRDRPISPTDCSFFNNVVSITGHPPVTYLNTPGTLTYDGNVFYRSDATVTVPSGGFVDVDPNLQMAVGDSIFRPIANSPLVGAAVTLNEAILQDFEQHSRPASNATIGADEISEAAPIDRGYYGPNWEITNIVLPTELFDFSIRLAGKCIAINWQTGLESGVDRYELERSHNGSDYETIGTTATQGLDATLINLYSTEDCILPNVNRLFYRLKTIDVDGSRVYSEVETVDLPLSIFDVRIFTELDNSGSLKIPIESNLIKAFVSIIDVNGQVKLAETAVLNGESFNFGQTWASGYYLIVVRLENGEKRTIPWIRNGN